jgi:phosphoglycolate phosphatase-like HAD superfamily hydrolase
MAAPDIACIVFDFDGVILESVDLKAQAFRRLFADYPDQVDRIVQLHLENGGLSRYEKFRRIYADYLHLPLDDAEMARLDHAFGAIVAEEIARCPFVPGAREFIARRAADGLPLYVASGTPEVELQGVIAERGLRGYFRGVYGSPRPKPALLHAVLTETALPPPAVLMIGDSPQDYQAAEANGARFVGRVPVGATSPFPPSQRWLVHDLVELEAWWERAAQA